MSRQSAIYNLPVFPLNTVLFPFMPVALHIFEERYKAMIADIREADRRFCVALIHEGEEVGGSADPYPVACLADIVHLRELPHGGFYLVAVGVERVRIITTDPVSKPYLLGSIELWPDESAPVETSLLSRASRLFMKYAGYILELSGEKMDNVPLPTEPDALSYVLATALQVSASTRQQLLEMPDSASRLQAEVTILEVEIPMLRALASSPRPPVIGDGKFSAN